MNRVVGNEPANPGVCCLCGEPLPAAAAGSVCARCALQDALVSSPDPATPAGLFLDDLPREGEARARLGPFELLEPLAAGGMGAVYKARQTGVNRIVAVKVLLGGEHALPEVKRRFRQEAEAAARLGHPNIVTVFDIGEHHGTPYFAMEYVEGCDLERLAQRQLPTATRAAEWVQSAAETMAAAHRQAVWHRDLKPSNLILANDGRVRITDFGLAHLPEQKTVLTHTGQTMGSPGFLPPEQVSLKRGAVGAHSDVYSLGAVLYFLLTGRAPFQTNSTAEAFHEVLHAEPVPPRRLNPAVPRELETIALKCLEKSPARRYVSAQDLADDLGRFLRHEPIRARPASAVARLVKWARRRPELAALWGLVGLVVVGGVGLGALHIKQIVHLKDQITEVNVDQGLRLAEFEFEADRPVRATRRVVEAVRQAPKHRVGVPRLMSILMYRGHVVPTPVPQPAARTGLSAFDAEGKRLLTHSEDGLISIWDLASGTQRVSRWLCRQQLAAVGFSEDGRWVYTAGLETNEQGQFAARVWNALSGEPRSPTLVHTNPIVELCCSADASRLTTLTAGGTARCWDTARGTILHEVTGGSNGVVATLSPDGKWLASASVGGRLQVWEVATGRESGRGATSAVPVTALAFDHDATRLAATSWDRVTGVREMGVWQLPDWRMLCRTNGVGGSLAAFNRVGDRLLVQDPHSPPFWRTWLLHPDSLQVAGVITNALLAAHGPITAGGLIPAYSGSLVRVYRDRDGAAITDPFDCGGMVSHVACSDAARLLSVVIFGNTNLGLRVVAEGKAETRFSLTEGTRQVAFRADGRQFAAGGVNQPVEVRETASGALVGRTEPVLSRVETLALSHDGAWLAVATTNHQVQVWDVAQGRLARESIEFAERVTRVGFSPGGRHLAVIGGVDLFVLDWQSSAPNGAPLAGISAAPREAPWTARRLYWSEFSPDGQRILAATQGDGVQVWDVANRSLALVLPHKAMVPRAHFSRDGRRIVTACADGAGRLWDATNGEEVLRLRHEGMVVEALLTSDGERVVTASTDGRGRVWSAETGSLLAETLEQGDEVLMAAVSGSDRFFATITHGGWLRVWDLDTAAPVTDPMWAGMAPMAFLPGAEGVAFYDGKVGVQRIELGPWPSPCPQWVLELASATIGHRFSRAGRVEPISAAEFLALGERIRALPANDPHARWLRRLVR